MSSTIIIIVVEVVIITILFCMNIAYKNRIVILRKEVFTWKSWYGKQTRTSKEQINTRTTGLWKRFIEENHLKKTWTTFLDNQTKHVRTKTGVVKKGLRRKLW